MLLIVLFTTLLFLTPQAESHVGPSSEHLDSNRDYSEGEEHRHKIRAIGVTGEDYTKTHLEDDGLGTKIVSIPVFDRDLDMSPCYEIDIPELETAYSYTHRRNPHPFVNEGIEYPTLNPPHNVSVIAVGVEIKWNGGSGLGLDYETASGSVGNRYYDYTITAWDARDEGRSCSNSSDSAWKESKTFRLYVTDVDETINYPPTFDTQMDQMAVFENADPGVEICCSIVDVSDRDTPPEDLVYSLSGPDASAFRITTGATYPSGNGQPNGFIFATQTFDYETKNRYEVTARVEDPEGLFLERSFIIHIVDVVNEGCAPPHFPGNGISPFDVRVHLNNTDSNGNIRPYDDGNCTVGGGNNGNNNGNAGNGGNNGNNNGNAGNGGSNNNRGGSSGSGSVGGSSGSGRSGDSGGSSGNAGVGSSGSGRSGGSGGSSGNSGLGNSSGIEQNGHVDFCRDFGPCSVGEGDCDGNNQCESGLQCSQDVGADYGFRHDYDVCEGDPVVGQNGHVDFCRDFGPCSVGEGDCDGNNQCESGLHCSQDIGADYGFQSNYDVCEATPNNVGHVDYCRDEGPCSVGEGDCDSTSECENGLQCSWNVGADYGFPSKYDVCE